jgi:hypothetical protein
MNTILIIAIIIGGTMAHVKGHINVPAQKASSNEVKDSFFTSFKKTLFGDNAKKQGLQFKTAYPNIKIKLYKKGGKVSK